MRKIQTIFVGGGGGREERYAKDFHKEINKNLDWIRENEHKFIDIKFNASADQKVIVLSALIIYEDFNVDFDKK